MYVYFRSCTISLVTMWVKGALYHKENLRLDDEDRHANGRHRRGAVRNGEAPLDCPLEVPVRHLTQKTHSTASLTKHMPFNSISHKTHAIQQHLSQNTCHSTASLTKHMPFNSISHKTHAIQQHLSQNTCHSTASLTKHMPFKSISHKTHAIQQHLS